MSDGSAICWPEQFPGERDAYLALKERVAKENPGYQVDCCGWNSDYYPCKHCQVCKRFLSNMQYLVYGGDMWFVLVAYGMCKNHGKQYVDTTHYTPEMFEGGDDE
jgi:hypothetical protein